MGGFEDILRTWGPGELIVTRNLYFCNLHTEISFPTNFSTLTNELR